MEEIALQAESLQEAGNSSDPNSEYDREKIMEILENIPNGLLKAHSLPSRNLETLVSDSGTSEGRGIYQVLLRAQETHAEAFRVKLCKCDTTPACIKGYSGFGP